MAGILHQLLDKHAPIPEGRQGLCAGPLKALLQAVVCTLCTLRRLCRPEVGPSDQIAGCHHTNHFPLQPCLLASLEAGAASAPCLNTA